VFNSFTSWPAQGIFRLEHFYKRKDNKDSSKMPIIKSAKKRVRVARKATVRNVKTKRSLRVALKSFHAAITGGKKDGTTKSKAQSALDKAAKKGVMHKNKVARKQRQLAAAAKKAGVKPAASTKKTTAKPVAKKTAPAKKAVATKKPVAKKTAPAKKPVAKKTTTKK
jgi:ribosomal protein S20